VRPVRACGSTAHRAGHRRRPCPQHRIAVPATAYE